MARRMPMTHSDAHQREPSLVSLYLGRMKPYEPSGPPLISRASTLPPIADFQRPRRIGSAARHRSEQPQAVKTNIRSSPRELSRDNGVRAMHRQQSRYPAETLNGMSSISAASMPSFVSYFTNSRPSTSPPSSCRERPTNDFYRSPSPDLEYQAQWEPSRCDLPESTSRSLSPVHTFQASLCSDSTFDMPCTTLQTQLTPPEMPDKPKKKRKARICSVEGCAKYVVDRRLCISHGGGKRCSVDGCNCRAQNRGLCWKHGGYTICKVEGCTKRAKSRGICWTHGGGTRCKLDGCTKIAVSLGRCWAHGGGKRCTVPGCRKPGSERTQNHCNEHYTDLVLSSIPK